MLDANSLLHAVTALFITVIGWYINRAVREKDKFESHTNAVHRDLDIRIQFLEQRIAISDTKSDAQATTIAQLHEDLSDIRDNMVRKDDFNTLSQRIDVVIDRTR